MWPLAGGPEAATAAQLLVIAEALADKKKKPSGPVGQPKLPRSELLKIARSQDPSVRDGNAPPGPPPSAGGR